MRLAILASLLGAVARSPSWLDAAVPRLAVGYAMSVDPVP
jgi:hypothetical protein